MSDQPTAQDWQDLHGIGLFLSCFCEPVSLQDVSEAVDWPPLLRCEPELAAERLIAEGLLQPVESADPDTPLLQCTKRGEIRSRVYLEHGAPHLSQQEDLPHASWSKAVMWLITAIGGGILGNAAYDILTALIEEVWEQAPSEPSPVNPSRRHAIEPELVRIPASSFLMGSSDKQIRWLKERFDWARDFDFSSEQPQHAVRLPTYHIGRYPVTNLQYAAFVKATGHDAPWIWTRDRYPSGHGNHPLRDVSWHDAQAYVAWLRDRTGQPYRLPTEAEWEKAARGADGRIWPWGDRPPDRNLCSFDDHEGGITPVGRYSPQGDSPYGCADMVGNVWEWCSTAYEKYPYDAGDGREEALGGGRVRRGGAWWSSLEWVRCASRDGLNTNFEVSSDHGFRVARGPLK